LAQNSTNQDISIFGTFPPIIKSIPKMSITEYNGGGLVAMVGKNCVAIASDRRYGIRNQTVGMNFERIFKMHDSCFVGLSGLATDVQTVSQKLKFRANMYKLREERDIKPSAMANLVSSLLYEKRFGPYFCEPIICGIEGDDNKPFICAQDLIGAACYASDFVVGGTCGEALYGMCESLFKKDMEPEDLFETISQALLSSVDRDCLSGWGAVVHIITVDKIITRELKGRQD
jgi:20S proteasome subunit beta 3